jgi:hypothetical protein
MKIITNYKLFLESSNTVFGDKNQYKSKDIIGDICIGMLLLNNDFLSNILDKGLSARYSENSDVFLIDLKNILLSKNRLRLGKFVDGKFVDDEEYSKINDIFKSVKFNIDTDWNKLVNYRVIARNIIDKLLPDEKLTEDMIKRVYLNIEKNKENCEDIIVETKDGSQYSFYLYKNMSMTKSASFNTLADDLIGPDMEKLFNVDYIKKWNRLAQEWVKVIYENSRKNIQVHIEKFVDTTRIDTIGWFEYFNLKHRDPSFSNLGENIKEFDKNILKFSDLLSEIWKNRDICFDNPDKIFNDWMEKKIFILNSKILEHILTDSLSKKVDDVKKLEDGFKTADGSIKMKLIKTIVEKLNCLERPVYYLGNNGNSFYNLPSRQFFRDFYNDIKIKFDYHVKMVVNKEDELRNNDFVIKMIIELDEQPFINCNVTVKFSGGDISSKLSAQYKFEPVSNFNLIVYNKINKTNEY